MHLLLGHYWRKAQFNNAQAISGTVVNLKNNTEVLPSGWPAGGLKPDSSNSIADALVLLQFCTKPPKYIDG